MKKTTLTCDGCSVPVTKRDWLEVIEHGTDWDMLPEDREFHFCSRECLAGHFLVTRLLGKKQP